MSEHLLSVGLDVGTTSTQLVVSRLRIENRASSFAVPEMEISQREVLYQSPVYFTPLVEEKMVDGEKIRTIVEEEYKKAGICREDVDTGAIIITGETSRRENARRVVEALSAYAGDFVVATAGPELESVLAAKGAGAVTYSASTGKTVLHMDIGGGTSNLALIRSGKIQATGCLNVGGRLVKLDKSGTLTYVSPVLQGISSLKVGHTPTMDALRHLAQTLVEALEMAAGLRPVTPLLERLRTKEGPPLPQICEPVTVSFSGGVADCIAQDHPALAFGDLGPILGKAIRESALCTGEYVLGQETIRATVIGAGSHSTQLSGSTVFAQNIQFPLKNVPVVDTFQKNYQEGRKILSLPGLEVPSYSQILSLAETLAAQAEGELLVCLEQDMAKALGQALALRLPPDTPILCIDRIKATENTYLDIGRPICNAFPVVVKTLVLPEPV